MHVSGTKPPLAASWTQLHLAHSDIGEEDAQAVKVAQGYPGKGVNFLVTWSIL